MQLVNSPVSKFEYKNRIFYVKRDDLLSPEFSGNKARKLAYYLDKYDNLHITEIISYGGYQSNLMYSLSCLAKLKKWKFTYYTRKLAKSIDYQADGNLSASLANKMNLVEIEHDFNQFCQQLEINQPENQLLIKQGGAQIEAEYGIAQLAQEIKSWATEQKITNPAIFLASGTGVSALYLQKNLPEFTVYTTNCVGSTEYLQQQFIVLEPTLPIYPTILTNKFRFANPDVELLTTWQNIRNASSIDFDLIYDPVGWKVLLDNLPQIKSPILYIHCGGLLGNNTMLQRYNYLNLID